MQDDGFFSFNNPGNQGGLPNRWAAVFALLCLVVLVQLVRLQVVQSGWLKDMGQQNVTNKVVLTAKRGTIYDRKGNVLAASVECKTVYANPKQIDDTVAQQVANLLAQDLGGKPSDFMPMLKKDTTFAYVKRKVDDSVATQLETDLKKADLPGIYFLDDTKRVYPYGNVAGQILGIVGTDGDGLTGLELEYNDILSGTDGSITFQAGLDGTPIAGGATQEVDAKNGTDIVLSLDVDVQQMAEEKAKAAVEDYEAESGSVMVVDPKTGGILAACSTPYLDITDTSEATSDEMSLKLVSDSYEPGSIFKVLTMAIALEQGTVTADTSFQVPPRVLVGSDYVRDDDGRTQTKQMDLREILRRSSNTGAVLVGQTIGQDKFAEGIAKFGIGQKTGIDFPGEAQGIVTARDKYTGASLGVMSFGQGLAVPMVQMVRAYTAIANGGIMSTPHFLVSKGGQEVDWSKSQVRVVSAETAATLTDLMRTVMHTGTGAAGNLEGYDVAGKTGTGEQVNKEGTGYEEGKYMSSLMGFANASDPSVLVYVGLNGTTHLSSSSAAPAFAPILSVALQDMGVSPNTATAEASAFASATSNSASPSASTGTQTQN